MPTEEVVIKINTVLGTSTAAPGANTAAQQAGNNAGNAFHAGLGNAKKANENTPGGKLLKYIEGISGNLASGNITGLAGMAGTALGIGSMAAITMGVLQKANVTATMQDMGLNGGQGLRGQGLYGMAMGVKDWWQGRSTKEAIIDLERGQGDFRRSQLNQMMGTEYDIRSRTADVLYQPITQPERFQAAREQRARLGAQFTDMQARNFELARNRKAYSADIEAGKYLDIHTGATIDREQALKTQSEMVKQEIQGQNDLEKMQKERRDFEFGQLGMRRQTLHGFQQAWGMMPNEIRANRMNIAERMKAGKNVLPEEIESLKGLGVFDEQIQQYAATRAEQGPFGASKMLGSADDAYNKAAVKAKLTVGGDIGLSFDEQEIADIEQKMLQAVTNKGNELRQRLNDKIIEAGNIGNQWQMGKQLISNGILKE